MVGQALDTTLLLANKALNKLRTFGGSSFVKRARAVGADVWSGTNGLRPSLNTARFGMQAGGAAAIGGAAGYFAGDGDLSSVAKGAGLGVLGAVGYRGVQSMRRSSLLQNELRGARNAISSRYSSAIANAEARAAGRGPAAIGSIASPSPKRVRPDYSSAPMF